MDSHRFDDLTRTLSSGSSRRTVLRGMLGGFAALAGLGASSTAAAPKGKVDVCHYDADSSTYRKININGNALQAHLDHGDNSNIGCAGGFELDLESCTCQPIPNPYACDVLIGRCGDGGLGVCLTAAAGGLVCIDAGAGQCDSCVGGCGDGWVCVRDHAGGCGGNDHCHPLVA